MKPTCTVRFNGEAMTIKLEKETLLESLLHAKIKIEHSCGGNGTCTTCLVRAEHWAKPAPQRTELEQERAEERSFDDNERLSCQLEATNCVGSSFVIKNIMNETEN